ncbi:MAG: aminotransferase class IV [Candidatus Micrarchaeia archaeon]|jgi:branched-chain amino acid aminotransferase
MAVATIESRLPAGKVFIGKNLPDMGRDLAQIPVFDQDHNQIGTIQFDKDAPYMWVSGKIVPVEHAVMHTLSYVVHYGGGGFEGERCYVVVDNHGEPLYSALFRNGAHKGRFIFSAHTLNKFEQIAQDTREGFERFPYTAREFFALAEDCHLNGKEFPYTLKAIGGSNGDMHEYTLNELVDATRTLMTVDGLGRGYIRPFFWVGGSKGLKVPTIGRTLQVAIAPLPWGTYLQPEHYANGLTALVAPFPRIGEDMDVQRKLSGNYLNSSKNANVAGMLGTLGMKFGEVLVLNQQELVVEGSAENLFVLKQGVVYTPPISDHVLPGITRDSVVYILEQMGVPVEYKSLGLDEVKGAEAVMLTGTGAELIHLKEIGEIPNLTEAVNRATLLRSEEQGARKQEPLAEPIITSVNGGKKHKIVQEVQDRFRDVFVKGTPTHKTFGERWLDPLYVSDKDRAQMIKEAEKIMRQKGPAPVQTRGNGQPLAKR